jgi:hydrogenase expression/formation protein HypC
VCVAVPLKVKSVGDGWAEVFLGGGTVLARTDLVEVREGDYVLVHAGFIIEKIDNREAEKTIQLFSGLKEIARP